MVSSTHHARFDMFGFVVLAALHMGFQCSPSDHFVYVRHSPSWPIVLLSMSTILLYIVMTLLVLRI